MSGVPLPLPDPALADGPVQLRPWMLDDVAELAAAWSDPEVCRWTGVPKRADETAAGLWIAGESDRRARGLALDLVVSIDGCFAGEVGLAGLDVERRTAEMGWWVTASERGRGLAARAARLMAQWALDELCVESLLARCHRDNPASGGVARAAGFTLEGRSGELDLWRCC